MLFDMHCHLGFSENAQSLARMACEHGAGGLSVTVEPREYERLAEELSGTGMRVGLGMHPWWIAEGRCGEDDAALFERLAPKARFIGEAGLDFSPRFEGSREAQLAMFERMMSAIACGGEGRDAVRGEGREARSGELRVISLHAVRATAEVLDVLGRSGALSRHRCVFHWFSGSSEELNRAVEEGCYFSVGERMLATKRGRAYARAIPVGRLLLETDYPSEEGVEGSFSEWFGSLGRSLALLADIRGEAADMLAERIGDTSRALLE